MSTRHTNTLRYWFDVEALMYPEIPKPGKRQSYTLRYNDPLPWTQNNAAGTQDVHKFFVYFGLVQKKVLETELFELFRSGSDADDLGGNHTRNASGKTFLCAIEISGEGVAVPSTLQLAAFSVAFAERKNQKRFEYSTVHAAVKTKIERLLADSPSGVVDSKWFEQVTEFLIEELNWHPRELMAREQICMHRVPLAGRDGKKLRRVPEMEPINSFYLEDLERILADAEHDRRSAQVERYLNGSHNVTERTDVTQLNVVNAHLAPTKFPLGRWPSKFPLFLMQQVAVNTALATLERGGIFSVNGPPGTGKTTLLMDVIAARIVERAKVLAEFSNPEDAFSKSPETITYPANASGISRNGPCFYMDERLLDFGIVVASANNKAVENITLDLPNLEKVFPQPLKFRDKPFDYFSSAAESILNPESQKSDTHGNNAENGDREDDGSPVDSEHGYIRCWGLVSVPLGKKSNRDLVARSLGGFSEFGISKALDAVEPGELDWEAARNNFRSAVSRVVNIQKKITEYDKSLPLLLNAQRKLNPARLEADEAEVRNQEAQEAVNNLVAACNANEHKLAVNLEERKQFSSDWPWWRILLAKVFNPARYQKFQLRQDELEEEYSQLRSARSQLEQAKAVASANANEAFSKARVARTNVVALEKEVLRLKTLLQELGATLGPAAFNPAEFQKQTVETQQKSLPRSNDAYQAARAEVFIAALHLHKAFMKNAGKPFETNLRLAFAMLEQQVFIQKHLPRMAPHLWATFFLVVPVVSSTFASFSRCFRDLGKDQIGLLLVDEAGQAVPSHALGAIWRSKRALIVGDPLQVEPVITMDTKLDYEILKYHQAPEEHLLTANSAQHLADRGNPFGSNVRQFDGSDLWVGAPLRVHRRCVDPMFSLSNNIAYNEKMVFGPNPNDEIEATAGRPLIGPSCWIDVVSKEYDEHFSPTEGTVAVDIVIEFQRRGFVNKINALPELFIISPFKSVAADLTSRLRERSREWAGDTSEEAVNTWLKGHVGTVHTFQGKECETVVFVLGGSTSGARNWAASRPNIINVAVTRAKRRLYVVGNRQHWSTTTFGAKLVKAVSVREPSHQPDAR